MNTQIRPMMPCNIWKFENVIIGSQIIIFNVYNYNNYLYYY